MQISDNSLYFAKLKDNAIIPSKTEENAGYDIYACSDENIAIYPHETKLIPTGIAAAVSKDYYLQVQERGSTGSKGIKYGAGVIDSGYRGEIFIAITNTNDKMVLLSNGQITPKDCPNAIIYPMTKAIAQLIVHRVPQMKVKEIPYEELINIESERGTGALGSSEK